MRCYILNWSPASLFNVVFRAHGLSVNLGYYQFVLVWRLR